MEKKYESFSGKCYNHVYFFLFCYYFVNVLALFLDF